MSQSQTMQTGVCFMSLPWKWATSSKDHANGLWLVDFDLSCLFSMSKNGCRRITSAKCYVHNTERGCKLILPVPGNDKAKLIVYWLINSHSWCKNNYLLLHSFSKVAQNVSGEFFMIYRILPHSSNSSLLSAMRLNKKKSNVSRLYLHLMRSFINQYISTSVC